MRRGQWAGDSQWWGERRTCVINSTIKNFFNLLPLGIIIVNSQKKICKTWLNYENGHIVSKSLPPLFPAFQVPLYHSSNQRLRKTAFIFLTDSIEEE